MKIGIDGRLWNETGVGRYIRNLVKELQEIDTVNEYVLFVSSNRYERIRSTPRGTGTPPGTGQELRIKNNWKLVPVDIRWHTVAEQTKFPQILYKENLDLMHFPYFSVPVLYNRPFVVTIHDLIIHYHGTGKSSTLPLPLYHAKKFGYKYVLRTALQKAKQVIVPLNTVKEDILQIYNVPEDKVRVTYEGVDQEIAARSKNTGTPRGTRQAVRGKYFLYIGNAYPHKNLERLLAAFVLFKKEVREDITLLLVGKDDYFYRRLEEKVKREKIAGVFFMHDVSDSALADLYTGAIALVSPSLMEGFGLPPLEAMASGCLLLLSDIPSFREVCQEIPFYFHPTNISAIKEGMQRLYTIDKKTKNERVRQGLARVKDFSWRRMAEQTVDIYENCVGL